MSEAQRRRVEAARAALEMALTAGLPGAGESTTVAAVLTAAVRAVVPVVAKRGGGCDVAAGKQVLPLLPWDDIEDWDDVGSDPEGAAEALVSSADAAELIDELYGPAESVMWCDDRGAGMTSSGLQGVSEFTHAGRVYFYEFGDIESIGDPGLWYAHDPGDDEARRAALVDAVGGIVGYGYGYLDTSIPDAPEVIAAAQADLVANLTAGNCGPTRAVGSRLSQRASPTSGSARSDSSSKAY